MSHQYKITVEPLNKESASLIFETTNHDDIIKIAERIRSLNWLSESEACSMAIGLKLLSEVTLKHREDPLLKELGLPLKNFIMGLKKKGNSE